MTRRRKKESKQRYVGIPHSVVESEDFKQQSGNALKILMILASQYNGRNNGDFSVTFKVAETHGIRSKSTLTRALKELQDKNLIVLTRQGKFINPGGVCSLYAVTWQSIDECQGKLDLAPTSAPLRAFSLENKTPGTVFVKPENRNCTHDSQQMH